ncbi:MAG: MBOAT family protein [Ruminococcus sp.]|nr:MBOAT family protein [Ruminococcus sp.]
MVFSSIIFLFAYFAFTLLVYYIVPRKGRNIFLFFVNLLFYGWGEPVMVFLMLFSIVINYIGGYFVEKYKPDKKKAKIPLALTVIVDIGILAFFKYIAMIIGTINLLPFLNIPVLSVSLPIGISFYTFQTMSYVIDVYRDDAPVSKSLINFGTYVALFPQLIAGPIVRYKDVAQQIRHRTETLEQFNHGVKLFMVGLGKKVLIANQMGAMWSAMQATSGHNGVLGSWVGIAGYTMQIYFDFSGYSDMACGLGNMFGFEFLKNFNYPYISKSVTEFWRRWHISLSTWFREYVYIPLGGNRCKIPRQIFNLLVVWFCTGLWHGASYNFILWGLYYGLILIIEKFVLNKVLEKLPSVLRHIYTIIIFMLGWVIFYFDNMEKMGNFFVSLFNLSDGIIGSEALVILCRYIMILAIAIVACTPLGATVYEKLKDKKYIWIAETLFCIVVLVISVAAIVNQSYNPFLYFRF